MSIAPALVIHFPVSQCSPDIPFFCSNFSTSLVALVELLDGLSPLLMDPGITIVGGERRVDVLVMLRCSFLHCTPGLLEVLRRSRSIAVSRALARCCLR